jgi:hypothetical protein
MLEEGILMSISARLSLIPQLFHKGTNNMCQKNLFCLISLVLLAVLVISPAKATYTDYIGAGHDSGVTVDTCVDDDTATGYKTVDGSGLSGGNHNRVWDNGWLAYEGAPNPNSNRSGIDYWIKYDFGEVYDLTDMWVWNSNGDVGESYTDRGLKDVFIDYSLTGTSGSWTQLASTQFPQANNSDSYSGFAFDFPDNSARYILISADTNWGATDDFYGLAEVKFFISTGPPDTDPPTPNPATWSSPPAAVGPYTIEMTATTATDPSGVQYYFEETSGNFNGSDSIWQTSQIYTDFGLLPETQYTYKVRARDQSVECDGLVYSTRLRHH